jgi:hypothetical protein
MKTFQDYLKEEYNWWGRLKLKVRVKLTLLWWWIIRKISEAFAKEGK